MELETHLAEFTKRDWQTAEDDDSVRFAIIGLGWWTQEQAIPAILESELCETTVVVTNSKEKANPIVNSINTVEHGLTYDEFHQGKASDAYDAVYIVTPNALHLEYVKTAADLSKAVLCEKPMEATVEKAERMVDVCEDTDVPLMIAYRMQTEPVIRRARDLVQDGFIGEPVMVHSHLSQQLLEVIPDPDQWRLNPELSGGSNVIDIGLYPLNTTRFVLDANPVAVQANTLSVREEFSDVTDEHVTFTIEFPNDVLAMCSTSQSAVDSSYFQIIGSDGEIRVDPSFHPWRPRGFTVTRDGVTLDHEFEQVNQMTEEFDYFADRILTDSEIHPNGRHGLVDIKVVNAIYEAGDRTERIEIDL